MNKIKLDLTNEKLFNSDELRLETNLSFLFGKNGTGKTTLTDLMRSQALGYDVRIFQGFEGVVGEKNRLNAVVLGDENNIIDKKIEEKNTDISKKNDSIKNIEDNVLESETYPDNLWSRHQRKKRELLVQSGIIEKFYTDSAKKIKYKTNPQISTANYNKNDFKNEIAKATLLSPEEISRLRETLITSVKEANYIPIPDDIMKELLQKVNELLGKKVEPHVLIEEFYGNKEKESFAEKGLQLHKKGEKCAFCGSEFTIEREEKLRLFFSADEMELFREEINGVISKVDDVMEAISTIYVDKLNFYPENLEIVTQIEKRIENSKKEVLEFLEILKYQANEKLKSLNETSAILNIVLPKPLDSCLEEYNKLVKKNNSSNLSLQQEGARNKLRYHEIKGILDTFKYDIETTKLNELQNAYNQIKRDLDKENSKIKNIQQEIFGLEEEIRVLKDKTKNEEKLAEEINKKLKMYVSFQLVYMKDAEEKGFYQIKCNRTSEIREVDKVSTGEKNIIAFLYFIEKLFEVKEGSRFPRLIIFDDPMNSNDDTMQYVIIEELQKLFPLIKNDERMVLLTHNSHFYLNTKYTIKSYTKNTFIHMISNGETVELQRISHMDDDFKTNYEVLWKELQFLFSASEANPSMLLNPIRRIVETYTKFNVIKMRDMLSKVVGAAKLFHVNSHSIDDLEAELGGLDKKSILLMLKECFDGINAGDHFTKHWGEI